MDHNEVFFSIYRLKEPGIHGEDTFHAEVQRCVDDVLGSMEYIWHRDGFQFQIREGCLHGRVRFDENMDDEWFVVWLLNHVSREVDGTVVHVWDNDGDFLLIEAAYSLPEWLEPDAAENRVWIMGGKVHCIPLMMGSSESDFTGIKGPVSVDQALDALFHYSKETEVCGSLIDDIIWRKISAYPEYAVKTMQHSPAVLPRSVASLIQSDPQSISRAVRSFHSSGSKERRAASKFHTYPLDSDEDLVPIVVCMNRCQYSQLVLTSYQAPDDSPWARIVVVDDEKKDDYRHACDVGFKIALGFEMLGPMVGSHAVNAIQELVPYSDNAWSQYKDDDSWLYTASDRLQEELDVREEEYSLWDEFDPDELVRRMKQFAEMISTAEGANIVDEEIQFDPDAFVNIFRGNDDASSVSEGSSFYALGSSSSDDETEKQRVYYTETDSDDEGERTAGGDAFEEAYSNVLADQLRGTSLDASFTRASHIHDDDHDDGTMNPVDVDVNLVSHVLASYEEQGALPGPASVLAGMLGVSLPSHKKDKCDTNTL